MTQATGKGSAEGGVDLWIGGARVPPSTGQYFIDRNPENDQPFARIAEASAADIDRAVQAAQAAFDENRNRLAADREAWLSKAAGLFEKYRDDFVNILVD